MTADNQVRNMACLMRVKAGVKIDLARKEIWG